MTLQEIDREIAYWKRERLKQTHPLQNLFWECTLRCNLACRHCGSDCKKVAEAKDMPIEDFLPVLDSIKRNQPYINPFVFTLGGEPLVRKDLCECGREITRRGFIWGTVTNAMLLDDAMMQNLHDAGLRSLAISMDGLKEEHNWMRRSESSFDRVYDAIGHARRCPDLIWDVITCVSKKNINTLEEVKRMLIDAGVRKWRCFTVVPMGRAKDADEMQLSPEEFRQLMDFIVKTRMEGKISISYSCEGFLGEYEGLVRPHHYSCQAGLSVASVLSDGGISGCLSIRSHYQQGNIYEDDFWDVWENRFANYRDREWMHKDECAECAMWRYCEGNGFHLRDDDGKLMVCHYHKLGYK